ncbi:MAG TPA: prevent-host-death protein [Oscillatoriales cyanobacterium M59_W2019_021]|nr:prevent-host-death protein [Oscillatoriales cyanobacterium M59_W2019_021]
MKQVLLSEVQIALLEFLKMAQEEDIVLIHEGKPIGYLVGFADEDDWIDYLMLQDPKFRSRLSRSLEDVREGRTIAFEKVKLDSQDRD